MENQPSTAPPIESAEWPPVPPAPAVVKPVAPPEPPAPPLAAGRAATSAAAPTTADPKRIMDSGGTAAAAPPAAGAPALATTRPGAGGPARAGASTGTGGDSAVAQLQRAVRRQRAQARLSRQDLVWQPRFAYTSAAVILAALTVVSMPLWIVLFRITETAGSAGGARVADLVALCMMLLGGFLAAAAAWVIIIEMRGRVRMVDTLARTSEREMISPAAPEIPVLDAPLEKFMVAEPIAARAATRLASEPMGWDAGAPPTSLAARAEAAQVSAAATLEASSKLLSSFSGVLKSFGQLTAQVAMLAVALALFVGATVLSLNG